MKPVFKCDYCKFMGTKEEVEKHEPECIDNYDKRSCLTCKYRKCNNATSYECTNGKEIPEGKIFQFCESYERKEKTEFNKFFDNVFGGFF